MEPDDYALSEFHIFSKGTECPAPNRFISSVDGSRESNSWFTSILQFRIPLTELSRKASASDDVLSKSSDADPWEYQLPFFHSGPTVLKDVGAQLWNGSLLLIDWIVNEQLSHGQLTPEDVVVDLGSGLGVTSIVASLCGAGLVFVTDHWIATPVSAELCAANFSRWSARFSISKDRIRFRDLDWFSIWPPTVSQLSVGDNSECSFYHWTEEDLNSLKQCDGDDIVSDVIQQKTPLRLILAADVVYDINATEALLRTVCSLLEHFVSTGTVLARAVFSVERRFCFTVDEVATTARAYDHFVQCLRELNGYQPELLDHSTDCMGYEYGVQPLPTDNLPQIVQADRNRSPDLLLWSLELCKLST